MAADPPGRNSTLELQREDLSETRVRLAPPEPPAAGEVQLRIERFALTANNVTYAVLGEMLGYWELFPSPDRERGWGVIPAMGWGEVVASEVDGIEVGGRYYGWYPMARYLTIEAEPTREGLRDASPHRAEHAPVYRAFVRTDLDPLYQPGADLEDRHALLRGLFATGYLADAFFARSDNLADLPSDGQSAITQRGLRGRVGGGCTYVGNTQLLSTDPAEYEVYSGEKSEFLALAPWVVGDGPRAGLREVGGKLAPGSGDELENDYLETALIADLPFPPDPKRASCNAADISGGGGGGGGGGSGRGEKCANRKRGTDGDDVLRGSRRGDDLRGLDGDDRLLGRGGRDCLRGQAGEDRLRGRGGRDRVLGGSGADTGRGGGGRDVLKGGSGPDRLVGGGGPDRIKGGGDRDQVRGSKGSDKILVAGGGRDVVRCGGGRDRVTIDREIGRAGKGCERVIER